MTTVVSNSIGTFTITDDDPFFLTTTGVINTTGTGIVFAAGSEPGEAIVAGNIFGTRGIQTNGNDHIDIAQTGTVLATDSSDPIGVFLSGSGNTVRIAGMVTSDGIGIYTSSSNNEIVITETGVVRGGASSHSDTFGNDYSGAIMLFSDDNLLVNNGDIIGELNPETGFRIAVGNAGSGDASNGLNPLADLDLTFLNSGFVHGDVYLSGGDDIYDARGGGIVRGDIDMGIGEDIFRGGEGDEEAVGGGGNDNMRGGSGSDTLNGQSGADTLNGDDGSDSLSGSNGLDVLMGGDGSDTLNGGANADTLIGGDGSDELGGGDGNDFMVGGVGRDEMIGGRGSDEMRGAVGDDQLLGGQGNDTLTGGSGEDTLRGDGGSDRYIFTRGFDNDVILDFSDNNSEKIDLSRVNSIVNFNDLSNNHLSQVGADTEIDAGNGNVITLAGFVAANLDAGDFLF